MIPAYTFAFKEVLWNREKGGHFPAPDRPASVVARRRIMARDCFPIKGVVAAALDKAAGSVFYSASRSEQRLRDAPGIVLCDFAFR
jgi:hypothetical protein